MQSEHSGNQQHGVTNGNDSRARAVPHTDFGRKFVVQPMQAGCRPLRRRGVRGRRPARRGHGAVQRYSAACQAVLLSLLLILSACAQSTPTVPTANTPIPMPGTATTAAPTATATTTARPVSSTPVGTQPVAAFTPNATATRNAASAAPTSGTTCAPGVELLGFSDALDKVTFNGTTVGGLSGLVYDTQRDRYYSLVDNERETSARIYTLRIPLAEGKLGVPTVEAVTILRDENGQPFTGRTLDGEGLALLPGGDFLVASETEPAIRRFATDGRQREQLPVPPRFQVKPRGEATENQTFESLALGPDGATLYTANEGPLAPDGFASPVQARLRLLRYDNGPAFAPTAQYFYQAEAAQGLSDIAALGPDALLTLERGFIPGLGNTVRLFRVALAGQPDVTDRASLADPDLTPVTKALVVDLGLCSPGAVPHPGKQSNPLLDNIESVALGPRLPDGRQTLILQSDDNFAADQVTRIYLLAMQPD